MLEYLPLPSGLDTEKLRGIEGWLSAKEAKLLYRLAKRGRGRGVILEIGSWKGRSTVCLALGSRAGAGAHIFAVDPFTGSSEHGNVFTLPEFQANISRAGVSAQVTAIPKPSSEAAKNWNTPIELLWIDGAHEEEFVRKDFSAWSPFLVEGGTIAFHDSSMPGPANVIEEKLYKGTGFHSIGFVHGITYARKGRGCPLTNRFMLFLKGVAYVLWRIKRFIRPHRKTQP
ncbi:MAG: class I SAM-dependent methyltransferase [Candidatus Peregrinibacteria bacterium]